MPFLSHTHHHIPALTLTKIHSLCPTPTPLSSTTMSCNICHTPILVNPQFLDPDDIKTVTQKDHLDPIVEQVCPSKIHQPYFKSVIQLDRKCEGVVLNGLSHAGRGLFFSSHWKITGGMGLCLKQEDIKDGISTCSVFKRSYFMRLMVDECRP
jgi:hypothetical protein